MFSKTETDMLTALKALLRGPKTAETLAAMKAVTLALVPRIKNATERARYRAKVASWAQASAKKGGR